MSDLTTTTYILTTTTDYLLFENLGVALDGSDCTCLLTTTSALSTPLTTTAKQQERIYVDNSVEAINIIV